MSGFPPRWLDSRVRLARFARRAMNHIFPDHWSFMLGEIAFYAFIILVITGTFLAMFFKGSSLKTIYHGPYHPLDGVSVSAAYQSVLHLSFAVPAGLLVRQMHHWAADIFIGAILAHMARIYFTAAYRKPRELNWIMGLTLLVLALVNGYLGYSICGDLLSGVGLRIGYAILLSVPVIGPWLTFLALGGTVPVNTTIPRLYALHIFLVPALIATLLVLHLGLIWRQLHTNYPGPRRTDHTIVGSRVWPSYTLKSLGLFLLVFAVVAGLGGLMQIDPVWIYGPYNPAGVLPGAQPDWYLGWVEGAMRLFPGVNLHIGHWLIPELFFPAVLMPLLVFGLLYSWPWIDKLITLDFRAHNVLRLPWQQPFNAAFGCSLLMFLLVLLVAGGDDVIAVAWGGSIVMLRDLLRWAVFIAPAVMFSVTYALCRWRKRKQARMDLHAAETIAVPAQTTGQVR
ncbi:MAG TPA: cytochrome bc complex cytochrome b subunit [Acidobacteriaceae bacterium]|jgi:ubiquinol-cytochrome c reductase cytochrome b subunit|nr:cytochrome bc complex cytochrome b subunit [Acidobacteriaceae bacterium]